MSRQADRSPVGAFPRSEAAEDTQIIIDRSGDTVPLERLVGSVRRDCVDHVVVLGERYLRHLLVSYQKYYNEGAAHTCRCRTTRPFGGRSAERPCAAHTTLGRRPKSSVRSCLSLRHGERCGSRTRLRCPPILPGATGPVAR